MLVGRAERVQKDELFPATSPRAGETFTVGELTAGYRYDVRRGPGIAAGIGVLGTLSLVPRALRDVYGRSPTSGLAFARIELR